MRNNLKIRFFKSNNLRRLTRKLAFLTALPALALPALAGNITVKGSDTLVILAQKWAEVYMSTHPEVKIQVTGGGSGVGFAALQNHRNGHCRRFATTSKPS